MNREDGAEDLLVLARQCKLGAEEERRFEIAVGSSRELELLYGAGVHFDAQAELLAGDEARLGRLVASTLARIDRGDERVGAAVAPGARATARRSSVASLAARYFAASLALGLFLSVALASAWDYVEQRYLPRHSAEPVSKTAPEQHAAPAPAAPATAQNAEPAVVPSATPSVVPTPLSSLGRKAVPNAGPARVAPMPIPASGALATEPADESQRSNELFARANQARREGDIEAAITLYQRLVEDYPSSVEAEDAKVLLGNLLLSQRSPRAALRQFEDYGSGALTLEALWGRAQALHRLGSADERAVLQQLVREYPSSPYSAAAKKRLIELSR